MVSKLLETMSGVPLKVYIYGAMLLIVLGSLLYAYVSGRSDGAASLRNQIERRNEEIKDEWRKIDDTPTDFDAAIRELCERSAKAGNSAQPGSSPVQCD